MTIKETKCVNCGCAIPVDAPQTATVSDEAVQAAFEEYGGSYRSIDAMKDALTAAYPHLTISAAPCSVEVKKLEWRKPTDHPQDMEGECSSVANGIGGRYSISNPERNKDGVYGWLLYLADDEFRWEWFPSIAEAKAAAQDDHDLRILSQIVTKPVDVAAVREQAFEEIAAIVDRYPLLSQVSAHIRALSPAEPVDQTDLSWLNTKTNFEISHDWPEGGDESDEGVWKVHSVNGGRSDREWTLIAEDSDLSTAIAKARKVRSAPTSKGGA